MSCESKPVVKPLTSLPVGKSSFIANSRLLSTSLPHVYCTLHLLFISSLVRLALSLSPIINSVYVFFLLLNMSMNVLL